MSNYFVRKLNIGKSQELDNLALAAGELYSSALASFWRTVRKKDLWIKPSSMMRWRNSEKLHAHSADAVVQTFYGSLKSWRQRRKSDPKARPPRKRRKFYKVQWKDSAIRIKDGYLILSNGKSNNPLRIRWHWGSPKLIEMGWNGAEYELRVCYLKLNPQPIKSGITVGIDLGEVHMAGAHTGKETFILNGRGLRSKRRYQNKLKAQLSRLIDTKKRGSRRRKQLARSKQQQLTKMDNQIRDILHKQTTKLISVLKNRGTQMVVIGDVRNIRNGLDYGSRANQKLHQWVHGKLRWMLTYKAEQEGMQVVLQDEAYTSQECPQCGKRHKPTGRWYKCKCGFEYHRDGVGAINIRKKYLGCGQVVGEMAPPIGLRHSPHAQCSSVVI